MIEVAAKPEEIKAILDKCDEDTAMIIHKIVFEMTVYRLALEEIKKEAKSYLDGPHEAIDYVQELADDALVTCYPGVLNE